MTFRDWLPRPVAASLHSPEASLAHTCVLPVISQQQASPTT